MRHLRRLSVTNWLGLLACITLFVYLAMAAPQATLGSLSTKPDAVASRSPAGAEGQADQAWAAQRLAIARFFQPTIARVVAGFVVLMSGVCVLNLWSTARLRRAYWHERDNG